MSTTELIADPIDAADLGLLNELKIDLVHRITEIDDLETIREVFVCLQQHAPKKVYVLSPEERKDIEQGLKSLDEGKGIPHEVVHRETQEWLKSLQTK